MLMDLPAATTWIACLSGVVAIMIGRGLIAYRKREASILDLPPELMDLIFPLLSQTSQACLAMSCKRFYHLFEYILKASIFRYPYSDGLDTWISVKTRAYLLRRLESPGWFWPYLRSRRWRYCYACLKLHPRNEFDFGDPSNLNRFWRRCVWPGIIVLCPCLKFSLKRLIRIYDELHKVGHSDGLGVEIRKHIPNWHQCTFDSPCRRLSYTLVISVSLSKTDELLFDFDYLVYIDRATPYQGERRIMLCPNKNALEVIGVGTLPSSAMNCPPNAMDCAECHIFPSITKSDDLMEYAIRFTRKFRAPRRVWYFLLCASVADKESADYNWNRPCGPFRYVRFKDPVRPYFKVRSNSFAGHDIESSLSAGQSVSYP